jgi:RNA polymerase sigma factor (sigma-70 family)
MRHAAFSAFLQMLRRVAARHARDEQGDAGFLARFVCQGDEAAFEALVLRHGPMVWGVCRRLLTRTEDAEDAFQAAFVVLLRRAGSIRNGALLGNWLYGVAYRVAVRARVRAARRAAREKQGMLTEPAATVTETTTDWQHLLHEEIFRLPEKYRRPIVMCYLNGQTNEEAAAALGWPVGTVKSRLGRARALLRARLGRRGFAGAALIGTLRAARLDAAVPRPLLESTLTGGTIGMIAGISPHALTLSKGVMRSMFWTRWANFAKALAVLALLAAGTMLSYYGLAAMAQDRAAGDAVGGAAPAAQTPPPKAQPAPKASTPKEREASLAKLKDLALAMNFYHSDNGRFPPAAVFSKDGKALLSWRVLLLPYLEQKQLFDEFKLDEPWDSEHNKKLLKRMPRVFAAPNGAGEAKQETFYQVFAGKGAIFEGQKSASILDIADGTANTILIIEGGAAVPWTKPVDLAFDTKKPLPRVGGMFPEGFHFARADGTVGFCRQRFREAALRGMITRSGGERLKGNPDDD